MEEWRTVFEGQSDQAPNINLDGGHLYRLTFWTPVESPDWLGTAIYNALRAIGLDVRGVAPGRDQIVITFWV